MKDFDAEADAVENKKDEQYVAMPRSWQARNNVETNKAMGYANMDDLANTPHPASTMKADKRNVQLSPEMPTKSNFNYNAKR